MEMDETIKSYLEKLYRNPKIAGSYSSADKFYREVKRRGEHKVSRKQVKHFLQSQIDYVVQKENRRKFKRRRVVSPYVGYMCDTDTANFVRYAKENKGFKHFVVVIGVMSKKAYTRPLKSLKAEEMAKALKSIFEESPVKFERMRSDGGSEYKGKPIKQLMSSLGIKHFITNNTETKANVAERVLKTLKSKLFRIMTDKNTHKWIDYLDSVTKSYMSTFHRSIQTSPSQITEKDSNRLWKLQYENVKARRNARKHIPRNKNPFKLKLGDHVLLSSLKQSFEKNFDESWSREDFIVSDRFISESIPLYKLKDRHGEIISGTFQEEELQKVFLTPQTVYRIEKIVSEKGKGKNKQYLVKWLGYDKKFNSYIRASELINFE